MLRLNNPIETVTLDFLRVAAFKFENNPFKAQQWVEVWVVAGTKVDGEFVQHVSPITRSEVHQYIKIENGKHPLSPDMALWKCECGTFYKTFCKCTCSDLALVRPYDGYTRMMNMRIDSTLLNSVNNVIGGFLCIEQIPDPRTWKLRSILDAVLLY